MGEAKRRRETQQERLVGAHCIYCAGQRPARTIDHMPPRAVFNNKHRPSGLEFPSCEECNSATRLSDQAVALMSRIQIEDDAPAAAGEVRKYLSGVSNNEQGLLTELAGPQGWQQSVAGRVPSGQHPLYVGGPLLTKHMTLFAAKFAFAMHYECMGEAVPVGGGVAGRWYSNADVIEGRLPEDIWHVFAPAQTLQQGRFNVRDQFEYSWALAEDRRAGMFVAAFRHAFSLLAFSAVDLSIFEDMPEGATIWRPGSLSAQCDAAA